MTILYLTDQDLDNHSGVSQKISMQSQSWKKFGYDVTLLSLETLSFFSSDGKRLSKPIVTFKRKGWRVPFHLFLISWKLKKTLAPLTFDLIYMRYRLYDPFFRQALKRCPQIVEINSDDTTEFRLGSKLLHFYNQLFRNFFLSSADGFVFVSHELQSRFSSFAQPSIVIANGIDTHSISYAPPPGNSRPALAFIGSPNQPWHGTEKICLMAAYLPEFDFHIIGLNGTDTQNLIYHGYLPLEEHSRLMQKMDVGIGTLSLHLKHMDEASPLKTRQYLAHGLPIIYAYKDTDICDSKDFALALPNTPDNIMGSLDLIREFVQNVHQNEAVRHRARNFALNCLDSSMKEKKRLSFFKKALSENQIKKP